MVVHERVEAPVDAMETNANDTADPASLRLQKRLYDKASRLAGIGAWECDLRTEALTWTDGVYDLFELPIGVRPIRRATLDLYFEDSRREMERLRAEAIACGRPFSMEARIRTARGTARWMRLVGDVDHEAGRPIRLFGIKQDITAEREAWSRLRTLAERDPLTGLANRGVFDARYRAVVEDQSHHAAISALALIDIDHFKPINDSLGHAAGDECLRQVAMRLERAAREAALIARIGGDEFAVLFRAPLGSDALSRILARLSKALSCPVAWNGGRIDLGASIGATLLGRPHRRRLSRFFAEADEALYAAKASGRNRVRIFDDGPAENTAGRLALPTVRGPVAAG